MRIYMSVYLDNISLIHTCLNNIEILCLHIFFIYPSEAPHQFYNIQRELVIKLPIINRLIIYTGLLFILKLGSTSSGSR